LHLIGSLRIHHAIQTENRKTPGFRLAFTEKTDITPINTKHITVITFIFVFIVAVAIPEGARVAVADVLLAVLHMRDPGLLGRGVQSPRSRTFPSST
jgi:hypothetical protein